MKKLMTAALLMFTTSGIFGQMVWVSQTPYQYDRPTQFFSTKAGHYLVSYSGGIKIVDSEGDEILELNTSDVFSIPGTHYAIDVIEMPDSTFAMGTYSYGIDTLSGNGWAYSSIVKFDQNGNGTLLAKDFFHADYGALKATLSDGSYVVLYPFGDYQIIVKDSTGEVSQEISLPGVVDLLVTSDDSLIVATEQGLYITDRLGNVGSTFPDFVFKSIKMDGMGRIVGVAGSTITLLSSDYQPLAQVVLTGGEVKDYAVVSDTVAILTTSNMVRLYSGVLSFFHEFPLGGNETYRYLAMNKGWIALAGEEVYGDVSSYHSTTSFIKEYSTGGASVAFTEDIGITDIDLGSNVVIEPTGSFPGHYWIYFPGAEITVHNYGPTPVDRFYLRSPTTNPAFIELTISPGDEVTVPWPNLRKLVTNGYPSGTTVDVCAWTSQPNLTFDADASNDLSCSDFLVSSDEVREELQIKIYPNPATCLLHVQLPIRPQPKNIQFRILDITGRVVKVTETMERTFFILKVDDWAAGLYFLHIFQDGALISSEKIIIAK